MREKAEARAKARASGSGAAAQGDTGRRGTMQKVLAKEEQRIETGSQVAGAQLTFAQQLEQAGKLLNPATKERLGSFTKTAHSETSP